MRVHCKPGVALVTPSITMGDNGHSLLKHCRDTGANITVVVLSRPHECSSPWQVCMTLCMRQLAAPTPKCRVRHARHKQAKTAISVAAT